MSNKSYPNSPMLINVKANELDLSYNNPDTNRYEIADGVIFAAEFEQFEPVEKTFQYMLLTFNEKLHQVVRVSPDETPFIYEDILPEPIHPDDFIQGLEGTKIYHELILKDKRRLSKWEQLKKDILAVYG